MIRMYVPITNAWILAVRKSARKVAVGVLCHHKNTAKTMLVYAVPESAGALTIAARSHAFVKIIAAHTQAEHAVVHVRAHACTTQFSAKAIHAALAAKKASLSLAHALKLRHGTFASNTCCVDFRILTAHCATNMRRKTVCFAANIASIRNGLERLVW